jgi:hypothetical protein
MRRWRKPKITETQKKVAMGAMKGATRGGLVGAVASIATGTAVVVTTPAWLPWVGGSMVVSATIFAAWTAAGTAVGVVTGGAKALHDKRKIDKLFDKEFRKGDFE